MSPCSMPCSCKTPCHCSCGCSEHKRVKPAATAKKDEGKVKGKAKEKVRK